MELESASECFLKIGVSNRCLEMKLKSCFRSHWRKHLQRKKALILKIEEKDGKKKKHRFPKLPKSHTDTGRLQMPFMKECTTNISIYSFWIFFFSKWQKTQLTGFTFVYLLLTLTFKHLSKLTKVVCIHAQLENILNLFKPEMHYQKCINIVHY